MDSIELLMQEHENIIRLTNVIRHACCGILEGREPDSQAFRDMIFVARNYADRHHHGKEEKILFRVMREELGRVAENLIQHGMLVEHDMGRLYLTELEGALDRYAVSHSLQDKLAIVVNAGGWADHLQRHAEKEDAAVYAFARRRLPADVLARVEAEMTVFEEENAGRRDQTLALLDRLCQTFGG